MDNNELMHYGVRGMKWGVRRYQKYDGSYTKAGVKLIIAIPEIEFMIKRREEL